MKKDIEEYFKLGIYLLHGIDQLYINSPADIKKKIIGLIFPEKLTFLKKNYRTAFFDELISLINSKHSPYQRLKIKTPRQNDGEFKMAPLLGLEPRTP